VFGVCKFLSDQSVFKVFREISTYSAPVLIMEQKLREKLKVPHFVKKRPCLETRMFIITKTGYIVMTLLLARLAFCKICSNVIPLITPSVHCLIKILFIFAIFRAYNCLNRGKELFFNIVIQLPTHTAPIFCNSKYLAFYSSLKSNIMLYVPQI
jgi:hypothetical protein